MVTSGLNVAFAVRTVHIDVEVLGALDRVDRNLTDILSFFKVHLLQESFHLLCFLFIHLLHLVKRHERCIEVGDEDRVLTEN